MHCLTRAGEYSLLVELEDWDGGSVVAEYSEFKIGPEENGFPLLVLGYSGDAGDALISQNGMPFSTFDNDADLLQGINMAEEYVSGWWFTTTSHANLNGQRFQPPAHINRQRGIRWLSLYSHKYASMKIKRTY